MFFFPSVCDVCDVTSLDLFSSFINCLAVDLVQMKVVIEVASFEHSEQVKVALERRYPLRWGADASLTDTYGKLTHVSK